MSGVKGRSGGARANSGGARPGAGHPPKKDVQKDSDAANKEPVPQGDVDMLTMLQNVALGRTKATPLQVRAAIAAVQYTHSKKGEGGKKDEAKGRAGKAASGRFAPKQPPLRVVSNS